MADIGIIEEYNHWQGASPADEILNLLEHNPYGEFKQMELNYANKTQPYNRNKALATLKKGEEPSVELSMVEPFKLSAAITRGNWRNTVTLFLAHKVLAQLNQAELFEYVRQIVACFPKFYMANISTHLKVNEFYSQNKLKSAPPCFNNFVNWYQLISPLAYSPYFTREELLNLPAHSARELDNGNIEIIAYPDPLSYDQPEVRERIVLITEYLNAHRHDWQKQTSLVG
jgi:hypothetical protein